jgi:hypothetical protein
LNGKVKKQKTTKKAPLSEVLRVFYLLCPSELSSLSFPSILLLPIKRDEKIVRRFIKKVKTFKIGKVF